MTFKDKMKNFFTKKETEKSEEEKTVEYSKSEEIRLHLEEKQKELDDDIHYKEGALKAVNEVGLSASFNQETLEYVGKDDKKAKIRDNSSALSTNKAKVWISEHSPFRKNEEKSKTVDTVLTSMSDKIVSHELTELESNGKEVVKLKNEYAEKKSNLEKAIKDKQKELEQYIKNTTSSIDSVRGGDEAVYDIEKFEREFEETKAIKEAEIQDLKAELYGGEKSDGTTLENLETSNQEQIENLKTEYNIEDRIERYLTPAKEKIRKLDEIKLKYQEMILGLKERKQKVSDDIERFNNTIKKSPGEESPVKSIREITEKLLKDAQENTKSIDDMMKAINLRLTSINKDIKEVNDLMIRVESVSKDSKEIAQMKKEKKINIDVNNSTAEEESGEFNMEDFEFTDEEMQKIENMDLEKVDPVMPARKIVKPKTSEPLPGRKKITMKDLEFSDEELASISDEEDDLELDSDESNNLKDEDLELDDEKTKSKKVVDTSSEQSEAVEMNARQNNQEQNQEVVLIMSRDEWMDALKIKNKKDQELFIEECGLDNGKLKEESARMHYIYYLKEKFPKESDEALIQKTDTMFKEIGSRKTISISSLDNNPKNNNVIPPEQNFSENMGLQDDIISTDEWQKKLEIKGLKNIKLFNKISGKENLSEGEAREVYVKYLDSKNIPKKTKESMLKKAFKN